MKTNNNKTQSKYTAHRHTQEKSSSSVAKSNMESSFEEKKSESGDPQKPQTQTETSALSPAQNSQCTRMIPEELSSQGITCEDLNVAVKVLNAVAGLLPTKNKSNKKRSHDHDDNDGNKETHTNDADAPFESYRSSSQLRPFRKALASCMEVHQFTLYQGKTKEEFLEEKLQQRSLKRQKVIERDMQRKHIANTALRKGRIERLQQKQNEGKDEEIQKLQALMMVPDGHVETGNVNMKLLTNNDTDPVQLPKLRSCYVCKTRFRKLHHFYDQLCPDCASLNWHKRHLTCDLKNKVAVVTGSRVKIGYQTCLKLLRSGGTVIATTRFPNAAAANYRQEHDFEEWKDRLQIFGLDLRDVTGLEAFCRYLKMKLHERGLDILINNACQTIRRPTAYFVPACQKEQELWSQGDDIHKQLLSACREFEAIRRQLLLEHKQQHQNAGNLSTLSPAAVPALETGPSNADVSMDAEETDAPMETTVLEGENDKLIATKSVSSSAAAAPFETTGMTHSAAASQMILLPEDVGVSESILPKGATDINGQQLDLRSTNSWLLKMDEVSTPEVMECMFINAIAPFVLNSRLKPLMCIPQDKDSRDDRYIINVSAMEGKFYRYKMANHPHTNMAKSALNMMTRTAAEDLAKNHKIYMNSIDTGWINDENPLERASKTAENNHFQTPIDEIDAAARIVDPIFSKSKDYGKFLKDYRETEW
jgi:NAD(P)-dependent dehydrogenase (short-subunit alcohol dehydrogenase family)